MGGADEHHAKSRVFALSSLFLLSVLPFILLAIFYRPYHYWFPDDAYYYFEIARNIAGGYGSTFDRINPTNGYHPLWCILLSLCGLIIPSETGFVIAVVILQCLLVAYAWTIAFLLLFRAPNKTAFSVGGMVSILFTWNYYVSKTVINGLESSLFLAMAATYLSVAVHTWRSNAISWRQTLALAFLGGLVVLARLDGLFFVMGALIAWVSIGTFRPRQAWVRFAVVGLFPFLVLGIYMLINWQMFGLWMPVSGFVKRAVWRTGPSFSSVGAFLSFTLFAVAMAWIALGRRRGSWQPAHFDVLFTLTLILIVYQADAWLVRGQILVEQWYLSPHLLWAFVTAILILHRIISIRPRLGLAVTGLVSVLGIGGIILSWAVRLDPDSQDHPVAVKEAANWINDHLPADAVLAGWDVGELAFYTSQRVMNLDGLVNSPEYIEFLRTARTLDFMDRSGVQYVVQHFKPSFHPFGLQVEEFWKHVPVVRWRRDVHFASMATFLKTGRRTPESYPIEVREFRLTRNQQDSR